MSVQDDNIRVPRPVLYEKEPIPDEVLDALLEKYSTEGNTPAHASYTEMWSLVSELKGWLSKPPQDCKLRYAEVAWSKIRERIDKAVAGYDLDSINDFSKIWRAVEIDYREPTAAKPKEVSLWEQRDKADEIEEGVRAAKSIATLISGLPKNRPNSPTKVYFLECIQDLQRKLKRAPSQREIEAKSGLKKNMVSKLAGEMGLKGFFSKSKKPG